MSGLKWTSRRRAEHAAKTSDDSYKNSTAVDIKKENGVKLLTYKV